MRKTANLHRINRFFIIIASCSTFALANNPSPQQDQQRSFIELKDFTKEEVKGIGFTIPQQQSIHISAVGGGRKSAWKEFWGTHVGSDDMYAAGWIIDANTREVVWVMTRKNSSGRDEKRVCEEDISLKKGSYEVYFSAYGFSYGSAFDYSSMNIDRREKRDGSNRFVEKFLGWFDDDYKSRYHDFMEYAKDEWGIGLSQTDKNGGKIELFNAPMKQHNVIFSATGIGDNAFVRKKLSVSRDVTVNVYAIGEGRNKNEVFDYGWITNVATRERVWEMKYQNVEYAGGADKNIQFKGEVRLPKGEYEIDYVTDGSHSREDWNMTPPYDPFNYGITVSVPHEADQSAISVSDFSMNTQNIIAQITRVRNDAFEQTGFTLKTETTIHIYALGEAGHTKGELADYGWIINAKTREHVWTMEAERSSHAGGALKNRLVDEVITLPKGSYIAYYQTDDSHAYGDWNDDKPYDEESYGITITGVGENFSMKNISKYEESTSDDVIVQLIRVGDDRHVHQKFSLDKPTRIRIYAIGEGVGNEMADYGWIENATDGDIVWEMTYRSTTPAGGARKNRLYDKTILLDKGDYEAHYQTDDSHAFNDWNDDPPEDRTHWGITIYKQ
ncbi:MAG: hypothetical protein WCT99_04730 [Bacteroidota bacterium]